MDYEAAVFEALGAGRPDIAQVYATLQLADNTLRAAGRMGWQGDQAIGDEQVKAHLAQGPPMLVVSQWKPGEF